jgi:hypothetical protein
MSAASACFDYRRLMVPAFDAPELGWGDRTRASRAGGSPSKPCRPPWPGATTPLNASRTVCMIAPGQRARRSRLGQARAGYTPYAETAYKGAPVVLLERHAS